MAELVAAAQRLLLVVRVVAKLARATRPLYTLKGERSERLRRMSKQLNVLHFDVVERRSRLQIAKISTSTGQSRLWSLETKLALSSHSSRVVLGISYHFCIPPPIAIVTSSQPFSSSTTTAMFRAAAARALRVAARPQFTQQVNLVRPQIAASLLRNSQTTPSLLIPSIRFYSAPAGLSREEVQGRIMDLLKNFDKVRHEEEQCRSSRH